MKLADYVKQNRARWMAKYGSDAGFDAWFTKQVA